MDIKNTISSTEARQNFADVIDKISNAGLRYTLTINGKPKVVMINAEEYDSWMETIDVLSDPGALKRIKSGEKQIKSGETISLDQLKQSIKPS